MNIKRKCYNAEGYKSEAQKRRERLANIAQVLAIIGLIIGALIVAGLDAEMAGVMHING